jgi:hypothetical protein
MRTKKNEKVVKMNLSMDSSFYELLKHRAKSDYVPVATWTKQFLMKNLIKGDKAEDKCVIDNEC